MLKTLDNNRIDMKKKKKRKAYNIIKGNRYRAVCYYVVQKKTTTKIKMKKKCRRTDPQKKIYLINDIAGSLTPSETCTRKIIIVKNNNMYR